MAYAKAVKGEWVAKPKTVKSPPQASPSEYQMQGIPKEVAEAVAAMVEEVASVTTPEAEGYKPSSHRVMRQVTSAFIRLRTATLAIGRSITKSLAPSTRPLRLRCLREGRKERSGSLAAIGGWIR